MNTPPVSGLLSIGLRKKLRAGYARADLGRDALAGAVVAVIALPLSMALAIASGVPPQYGLYTILGASVMYAMFASTRQVVTGPSASVAAVTAPVGPS
jgi:SulP family sulfate permease